MTGIISLQTASVIFQAKHWGGKFFVPTRDVNIIIDNQTVGITGQDGTVTVSNLPPNTKINFSGVKEGYTIDSGTVTTGDVGTITYADPLNISRIMTSGELIFAGITIGATIVVISYLLRPRWKVRW